jgi:prepilin-type N-terminal cleavage/methylation domain-containing protein
MKIMFKRKQSSQFGFTLLELLVVIAIIGIIVAVVMVALNESKLKGRDAGRKSQIQEILKALELHYSDDGTYPDDGTPNNTVGDALTNIGSGFNGGRYFRQLPEESGLYQYCVSTDRKSMFIAVNTEKDKGGSDYCGITRGPGPSYGCDVWRTLNALDSCALRF